MGSVASSSGGGGPTITVSSSRCTGSTDSGLTSSTTVDSTGAGALLVMLSQYQPGTIATITDNKLNTWVPATTYSSASTTKGRFYLATLSGGTRGASHTITATGSGNIFPAICAAAITGATQYGAGENGTSTSAATSASAGSMTPTGANFLVCSGISLYTPAVTSLAATSPLAILNSVAFSSGNNLGAGLACYQQSGGPSAINPNWTWTTSTDATVNVVSVKP